VDSSGLTTVERDRAAFEAMQHALDAELKEERDTEPQEVENPKDVVGSLKAPISCVPANVVSEVGVAMLEGSLKYGRHNYRETAIRYSCYYDACWRHLSSWWEGEDIDPQSGLHHITKLISSAVVLRDAMLRGNVVDDRPPKSEAGWMEGLNRKSKALTERCSDPLPPVTER